VLVSFHNGYDNGPGDPPFYDEVTTDENGRYEIFNKGRLRRTFTVWEAYITPTSFILARSLQGNLAAIHEFTDDFPTRLDLSLQPGITLSGSVKDPEDKPVTNATVALRMPSGLAFEKLDSRPTQTDARGSFAFPSLPQGRHYHIAITAEGYGTATGVLQPAETKTNHYEVTTSVLKQADRPLEGQVVLQNGTPVAGAQVKILPGTGQPQVTGLSDANGQFAFKQVCEGPLRLWATFPGNTQGLRAYQQLDGHTEAIGGDMNVVVTMVPAPTPASSSLDPHGPNNPLGH
jgi:hypothetical protein